MFAFWRVARSAVPKMNVGVFVQWVLSSFQVLVAGYIGGVCDVLIETDEIVFDEKSMGRNVQALTSIRFIPTRLMGFPCGLLWVARCNNKIRMEECSGSSFLGGHLG